MSRPISIKIDVTKIDKSKLFEGKNGAKYLDLIVLPRENDKYGNDFSVSQAQSKEEREQKLKPNFLGNGKYFGKGVSKPPVNNNPAPQSADDDSVPF